MGFPNDRAVTQPAIWRRGQLFRYSGQRRCTIAGVHAPHSNSRRERTNHGTFNQASEASGHSGDAGRVHCPCWSVVRPAHARRRQGQHAGPERPGLAGKSYEQIERPAASAMSADEQAALKAMVAKRKPEDIARFHWWAAGGPVYRWNEMILDEMQLASSRCRCPSAISPCSTPLWTMPSPQPGTTRGRPRGRALSSWMVRSRPERRLEGGVAVGLCRSRCSSGRDARLSVSGARRGVRGQGRGGDAGAPAGRRGVPERHRGRPPDRPARRGARHRPRQVGWLRRGVARQHSGGAGRVEGHQSHRGCRGDLADVGAEQRQRTEAAGAAGVRTPSRSRQPLPSSRRSRARPGRTTARPSGRSMAERGRTRCGTSWRAPSSWRTAPRPRPRRGRWRRSTSRCSMPASPAGTPSTPTGTSGPRSSMPS